MKKTLFYSKSLPCKSILRILKKGSGGKVRAPKRLNFMILGHRNFFPSPFFLYSDDTFIRQTFLVEQSFFHKFVMKKSFWGPKMHFSFLIFTIKLPLYFKSFPLCCPVYKEVQKCEPSGHIFYLVSLSYISEPQVWFIWLKYLTTFWFCCLPYYNNTPIWRNPCFSHKCPIPRKSLAPTSLSRIDRLSCTSQETHRHSFSSKETPCLPIYLVGGLC